MILLRLACWMLIPAVCILMGCTKPQESTPSQVLLDFEQHFDESQMTLEDARFELAEAETGKRLVVHTGSTLSKPGLVIRQPEAHPWKLTNVYQVKADVQNLGDEPIQVEMFVGNDPDGLIRWYCSDYVDLQPNEKSTITVSLAWTPWAFSPQPEIVGMRGAPGIIKTDQSKIDQVSFYSRYATVENSFSVENVRTVGTLEMRDTAGFFPFIDVYGQYSHEEWEGKVQADEDFQAMAKAEAAAQQAKPGPEGWSQYGGWAAGPQMEATGFFRTEKYKGKWYMVDPEGNLFWSAGMNCVASTSAPTGTLGREHYFASLPAEDDEFAQFYAEGNWASHGFYSDKIPFTMYNFYHANLYRKYGENWLSEYRDNIHRRFRHWGINTIGNVSDLGAVQQQKTPYVGTVWINGTPKIEGSQGFWGKFHDVFDPGFRAAVRTSMESQRTGAGDPWCIGFFVDNELSWGDIGSLSMGALRSPSSQPAKQEFVQDLRKKYASIETLNDSWGTEYASWEALLQEDSTPDPDKAAADLAAFYDKIAQTYFRIIKEELTRIAPKQCYLGCRFAWANNDPTVKAAAQYCDIVSFNKYEYSIENVHLPEGVDKPIMIGEFHFGALDRGLFHPGVKAAANQEERGEMYEAYIKGALRNDAIVGAHWFQYLDQAATGREDGENYNVGFVNTCDRPYEELIEKVQATTYEMYEYRSGGLRGFEK